MIFREFSAVSFPQTHSITVDFITSVKGLVNIIAICYEVEILIVPWASITIIFIVLLSADGAGGDLDASNITDLLNEPGAFNWNIFLK